MKTTTSKPAIQSAIGQATGKVILMGEHAVVHHQPAIAIPFSGVTVTAHIQKSKIPLSVSCDFYKGLAIKMPEILNSLKFAIHSSLQLLQQLQPNLAICPVFHHNWQTGSALDEPFMSPFIHISISSTIPAERGMGSSAAVAVAVVRALFAYYQQPLDPQLLWTIVQEAERIAHGNPSGIDTATTSGKFPIYFVKKQPIQSLKIALDAVLIVADTGITGHTLDAVQTVQQLLNQNSDRTSAIIQQIGKLTQQAKFALETNQSEELGRLMTHNHQLLQQLHVSHECLDHLVTVALDHGALGAKLTGGGLGGCMIALARDVFEATIISQALASNGATQTWYHPMISNESLITDKEII